MYGIKRPAGEAEEKDEEDGPEDIEASIKAELDGMKEKRPAELKTFSIIPAEVECLFFVKTQAPVDPVEFVRKVCIDARDCDDIMKRKVKYINRLSPVVSMEKATENGLLRVARRVMGSHFGLVKEEPKKDDSQEDAEDGKPKDDQVSEAVGDEQKASEGPGDEAKPSKVETGDTTVDESSTQEPMESAYTVCWFEEFISGNTNDVAVRPPSYYSQPSALEARRPNQQACQPRQARTQGQPHQPRQSGAGRDLPDVLWHVRCRRWGVGEPQAV